ncbi:SRPBCC family protein [Paenibacillus sinopodophylli]|uniref:SRPBCC family protein n=1 Tax=Paenibacillus sinopodophylli TaxID=1837342 RepID=UPI00110D23F0|nr:SRPBCC domain-containing protein [Paenibacillus sinopodophylli]
MSLTLSLDFEYKSSIEKVWSAITDSNKLAKWITENDFEPVVGHQFQFRNKPSEWWDGIINGEVLIVDAPNRLSYTWAVGDEKHTVTWTLQDFGNGVVNLHLEQTGITNEHGFAGAKHGWGNWSGELEKLLAQ